MGRDKSGYVLAAFITGIFLLLGILLTHYLSTSNQVTTNNYGNNGQTNQTGNQPTSNTQTFQCPDVGQVSAWTGANVNKAAENCAFSVDGHGTQLTNVICTTQDGGTTIEYTPVNQQNTLVIENCDGSQLPPLWSFTIRFVAGYPGGDAAVCSLAQHAPQYLPSGWRVQTNPSC